MSSTSARPAPALQGQNCNSTKQLVASLVELVLNAD